MGRYVVAAENTTALGPLGTQFDSVGKLLQPVENIAIRN